MAKRRFTTTVFQDVETLLREGDMTAFDIAQRVGRDYSNVGAACRLLVESGEIHICGYDNAKNPLARGKNIFRWGPGEKAPTKTDYRMDRKHNPTIYERIEEALRLHGAMTVRQITGVIFRNRRWTSEACKLLAATGDVVISHTLVGASRRKTRVYTLSAS